MHEQHITPETTIFLTPIAVGKSSTIRGLKQQFGPTCVHLDCNEATQRLGLAEGFAEHARDLVKALRERTPHIILSYYPIAATMMQGAIELSRAEGNSVVIEGITADPENTLPHFLQKQSEGWDLPAYINEFIEQQYRELPEYLASFKDLPDLFLKTAKQVDVARLWEIKRGEFGIVASWDAGKDKITNRAAFNEFLRLKDVTPDIASFRASFLGRRRTESGHRYNAFEAKPLHFAP